MINRERHIDIESLSKERAEEIGLQITAKMNEIIDKAVEDANRILGVYGMESKMVFKVGAKGSFEPKTVATKEKKRKKAPKSNL